MYREEEQPDFNDLLSVFCPEPLWHPSNDHLHLGPLGSAEFSLTQSRRSSVFADQATFDPFIPIFPLEPCTETPETAGTFETSPEKSVSPVRNRRKSSRLHAVSPGDKARGPLSSTCDEPEAPEAPLSLKISKVRGYWSRSSQQLPNVFRLLRAKESKDTFFELQDLSKKAVLVSGPKSRSPSLLSLGSPLALEYSFCSELF